MTLPEITSRIKRALRRNRTLSVAGELIVYCTLNTKFLSGAAFMALVCWVAH